jgi:hypothetical protein
MLALVQAPGLVHAHHRLDAGIFHASLEQRHQRALAIGRTTAAGIAGFTNVPADKNMMLEFRQSWLFLSTWRLKISRPIHRIGFAAAPDPLARHFNRSCMAKSARIGSDSHADRQLAHIER